MNISQSNKTYKQEEAEKAKAHAATLKKLLSFLLLFDL
jgi:hypothetical protein